jgi:hypothetical protein
LFCVWNKVYNVICPYPVRTKHLLLKELNERLQIYKNEGRTTLRGRLEDKCNVAVAIETLLLMRGSCEPFGFPESADESGNWAKEWILFQERCAKVTSNRQFVVILLISNDDLMILVNRLL